MPSDTCAQMLAAARLYDRLQSLGYWEQLHCPRPLGYRPAFHPVQEVGSACEAWVRLSTNRTLNHLWPTPTTARATDYR